jgi:aminotransferase
VEVPLDPDSGFALDIERVESACSERAKAIIINSPCNPTGRMFDLPELEALAELARRRNLWVLSDEVYERLVFGSKQHVSIGSLEKMANRTITINSFSKTYAMTGWRVGYAVAPTEIAVAMARLQENIAACVTSFAQQGALAALSAPASLVEEVATVYASRRALALSFLERSGVFEFQPSDSAFYLFVRPKVSNRSSEELGLEILNRAGVVVVIPGSGFSASGEGHLRIALMVDNERLISALGGVAGVVKELST